MRYLFIHLLIIGLVSYIFINLLKGQHGLNVETVAWVMIETYFAAMIIFSFLRVVEILYRRIKDKYWQKDF